MDTTAPITAGNHNVANANPRDAARIAETINSAIFEGRTVLLNGREVWARYGEPATTWGSGSISVETRSLRQAGKSHTAWVKSGDRCTITIGELPAAAEEEQPRPLLAVLAEHVDQVRSRRAASSEFTRDPGRPELHESDCPRGDADSLGTPCTCRATGCPCECHTSGGDDDCCASAGR